MGFILHIKQFLGNSFKEERAKFLEHRFYRFFTMAALILVVSALWGSHYFLSQDPETAALNLQEIYHQTFVEGYANQVFQHFYLTYPFLSIFLRNLMVAALLVATGFISFGFIPLYLLILNGYLIGAVTQLVSIVENVSSLHIFVTRILPHGFWELAALAFAGALGLNLTAIAISRVLERKFFFSMLHLVHISATFLRVVLPLLFIAALVEVYITPYFINI